MLQDVDLQYVNGVPTFGGPAAATALAATGLTGATAATRYAGATASGSPASGTFAVGDYVTDQTGVLWICTAAGTPGAWVPTGSQYGAGTLSSDFGWLAWNYDPMTAVNASQPSNSTQTLIRVNVRYPVPCANVLLVVESAGAALTANENFAGLIAGQANGSSWPAGGLIASTADQHTAWTGTGLMTMALSGGPYTLPAGFYWVVILVNESGGTIPSFLRASAGESSGLLNIGTSASSARWATNGTGTALASVTPSANTNINVPYWAGLS